MLKQHMENYILKVLKLQNKNEIKDLSETIDRKFVQSFNIEDYNILTDDGFKPCKAIHKTIKYDIWNLITKNYELQCADNHIVFDENYNQIFVKDLKPGDKIQTETGVDEVLDVFKTNESENMYDVELADDSQHRYYTNGILSHNTTTYTIFCLWYATLFADKKIMICANKLQTALEIMDRIRKAYENLPFYIKPGILTYNKGEIEFANGSVIRATSTSSSAARGTSCNCLVIDEMGFIPSGIIQEFWASVIPVVSSSKNSKIIIVSTPNGADGLYYDLWQQANSKNANPEGWQPFRIHWWEAGGIRDEQWKQQQIASIGLERWKQEFECDFLTSTTKRLIPDDILEKYRMALSEYKTRNSEFLKGKIQKIISEDETKLFEFTMWHEFEKDRTYAASGDIAAGGGGDFSVLYIWDITDLGNIRLCAKFDNDKISIPEFAYVTIKMLKLYGNPYYICERNGVGSGYIDILRCTYQYQKIVTEGKNNDYGVYSHVSIKSKACLWTRDMMTTQGFNFKIYDKDLIDEMSTFVKKDSKSAYITYTALDGAHDDHIMSFIWLCYILQSDIIEKYYLVCETFKDALGNTYAKTVLPIETYTSNDIQNITSDPMYKEFLDFKESVIKKIGENLDIEKQAAEKDEFQFAKTFDPYFNDYDSSQNSFGYSKQLQSAQSLNPNNHMPRFYIN